MNIPMRVAVLSETIQIIPGSDLINIPVAVASNRIIPMEVSVRSETLGMAVGSDIVDIPVECAGNITQSEFPAYIGPFEVTPGSEAQIIPTHYKALYRDIVVDPIPSNYGLITWNGSTITVS